MNGFERTQKDTTAGISGRNGTSCPVAESCARSSNPIIPSREWAPAGGSGADAAIYFLQQWFNLSTRLWRRRSMTRR